jgi:hypothetical protein
MIIVKVLCCRSSALKACRNDNKYSGFDAEGGYKSGESSVGIKSRVGVDVVARCELTFWSMLVNGELDVEAIGAINAIGALSNGGESRFVKSKVWQNGTVASPRVSSGSKPAG